MSVENILRVADAIERHEIKDLGFNMDEWHSDHLEDTSGHNCGTTACVGGWAGQIILGNADCCSNDLLDPLGINEDQAHELFFNWTGNPNSAQAVRTLRHLAATGKVRWDLPEEAA